MRHYSKVEELVILSNNWVPTFIIPPPLWVYALGNHEIFKAGFSYLPEIFIKILRSEWETYFGNFSFHSLHPSSSIPLLIHQRFKSYCTRMEWFGIFWDANMVWYGIWSNHSLVCYGVLSYHD